jgi:isopropylmalate/homocitrate/citramalate synthase
MTDVVLCECFARDGLQHETEFVPTPTKQVLIERFAALGFQRLEATTRRPAPMCVRSTVRWRTSTPASA